MCSLPCEFDLQHQKAQLLRTGFGLHFLETRSSVLLVRTSSAYFLCVLRDSETPLEFSDLGVFRTLADFIVRPGLWNLFIPQKYVTPYLLFC